VAGRIASTANTADRKAVPPRIRSASGAPPPSEWPTAMVKMTKAAPIRMLAFWSAIAERCIWLDTAERAM
jgi:hypothetical protein